ncbi:MAG: proline--tRNA ligase [Pseudomonadota bacterium]|nr:proline--tRNA ligase [Pseudomonadota bacterium]
MRSSEFFMPTLKENPSEAQIVSHRLMLRSGLIRQSSAGIYSWLPLGIRVLKKIERIIREEQDAIGAQEILMPTIQPADLWRKSGRYDAYGPEMLRITDRNNREMLYGPTNEEQVTEIFYDAAKSYRDLPAMLYHVQWKFRDEVRPRFGVMRGREFLMKDAYSFDADYKGAKISYNKQFVAYLKTFARLGLTAIPMKASSGPIGGNMSHEFVILADTGESEVACHKDLISANWKDTIFKTSEELQSFVDSFTIKYAATDEERDIEAEEKLGKDLVIARGIEVGHIFYFGKKYSESFNIFLTGPDGNEITPEMGSYGIGVSRLVGGIIEASHDENGIIWPDTVAPFKVGLINLTIKDETCNNACEELYKKLNDSGIEVLLDDRDIRAGAKFADMDLIGLPWQVVVGPKGAAKRFCELKNRKSGERQELSFETILDQLTS